MRFEYYLREELSRLNAFREIFSRAYTGEFYETEDENGNKVNCYHDMEGMIFSCKEE